MNTEVIGTLRNVRFGPRLEDTANIRGRYPELDRWIAIHRQAADLANEIWDRVWGFDGPDNKRPREYIQAQFQAAELRSIASTIVERLLLKHLGPYDRWEDETGYAVRGTAGTIKWHKHREEAP